MSNKPIEKQFWKYVLPSMLTMLLSGFYTIVDGFFVGRNVGDIGLAAINMAWPIAAFILAVGVGIGTGGAVLMSTLRGQENLEDAERSRGNAIITILIISVFLTIILFLLYPFLLKTLGASGVIYDAAEKYIRIIILGCSLQMFGAGLTPLLRNNGKTVSAMVIMITGLVINIVLDAWFIAGLRMGMAGAALATIIAQGVVALLSVGSLLVDKKHRFKKQDFYLSRDIVGRLLHIGVSPFGLSLSPSVIVIFNNWQCLRYGGNIAVAAYAVVAYLVGSVQLLLAGAGEGIQPLISFCSGAHKYSSLKNIMKKAVIFEPLLGIFILIAILPLRSLIPVLFGTSAETAGLIYNALFITGFAFPLIGLVRLSSSYFYAVGEHTFSLVLIYADPLITTPILLFILPLFWGINGIWAALPAAQGVLAVSLIFMYAIHAQHLKIREKENLHGK